MTTWRGRVRDLLPQGGNLPADIWRARHRGIVALLWAHAAFIPFYALIRGYSLDHAAIEAAIIPIAGAVALMPSLNPRVRTTVASLGLLACSGVLVHLSGGLIEMHFHFFVMVAVVALYQDWIPFLAAIAFVFLHHGLIGALDPSSVYNHGAARRHPWTWAGIHALFITGTSVACLVTWRQNEKALAEREEAEHRLREESNVVETLYEIGNTLAAELDTNRVMQRVTDAATTLTEAKFGAFFYNVVDAAGEAYLLYTLSGAPIEAFSKFGMPRNTDIFRPTFEGEAVIRLNDVTADRRYGNNPPHRGMPKGHLPVRSYLAVPVRSRTGEVLGGLFFGHDEVGRFTEVHERMAVGIAAQAAIALDNARFYEAERRAREAAETAGVRLALLADVSKILTSSLEVDLILRGFTQLVASAIADFCIIDLVQDDRSLARVATAGVVDEYHVIDPVAPATSDFHHPVVAAMASRMSQLVPTATHFCVAIPGTQTLAPDRETPATSALVVPLIGRGEVLGALSLVTTMRVALTQADVTLAEDLARRAAVAVENAGLYARQRTVAETLQHSLLPERLPEIPGLATSACYSPGGPGVEVGGDWYDVIQLRSGDIAVTIGDVVGRGERAASLMAQLRNAERAYAMDDKSPSEIAEALSGLLEHAETEHMATMFYGVLNPETCTLLWVNAGHPPPLLVRPDGTTEFLDGSSGIPLGAMSGNRYRVNTTALAPGTTIVLYTDGLVEDRQSSLHAGLESLRSAIADGPSDVDVLCRDVMGQLMAGREAQDDAAILALRLLPLGPELHLRIPSQPSVLAPLRATMRRWLGQSAATEQECYEMLVACGEACANAIRHAGGPFRSHFELDASLGDGVIITVSDHGRWRESRSDVGGRGLTIIEACMDDVRIDKGPSGTTITMRRQLARQPA